MKPAHTNAEIIAGAEAVMARVASDFVTAELNADRVPTLEDIRRVLRANEDLQEEAKDPTRLSELVDTFIGRTAPGLVAMGVRDDRRIFTGLYL